MKLTKKQETFAKEYLIDLNCTQAAIRAGYSEKTAYSIGSRLLKNVEILSLIEELREERAKQLNLDAYWVLKRLKEISDKSMQAEPVYQWDYEAQSMVPTGEFKFDSTGANKSTELIGKHLGMFKETYKYQGNISVTFVDDISSDDFGDEEETE